MEGEEDTPRSGAEQENPSSKTISVATSEAMRKGKRRVSTESKSSSDRLHKRKRTTQPYIPEGLASLHIESQTPPVAPVEEDDISAEVEARLRAKEEKRNRRKETRKRKRSSGASEMSVGDVSIASYATATDINAGPNATQSGRRLTVDRHRKKKHKSAPMDEPIENENGVHLQPPPAQVKDRPKRRQSHEVTERTSKKRRV